MSAKLIVASGKSAGRAITLRQGKLLIGRAEDCDIRPLGEEVSRRHCQIELAGDVITVADLGSRNGTYVNGDKIAAKTRIKVGHGDIVRVGPLEVQVETRAAGDKPASLETGDDVSRWLMADDEPAGMFDTTQTVRVPDASSPPLPAAAEPAAAEPTTGEQTPAPVSTTASDDSAARATASVEALLAARSTPASLPADAKKSKSDSSRDAAADALRKFFGKR